MAHNILKQLYHLPFPECTKQALSFLTSFISQDGANIPGYNANMEQIVVEVCQEFVLFKSTRGPPKNLTAVQELNLLDMICSCFSSAPEKSKYRIFNLMFGAHGDSRVNLLMTKLISLALSVRCAPVLICAAIWMQERDCLSPDVKALTERLVNDHCLLYPDPSNVFSALPNLSPLFACNFISSATTFYSFADSSSLPPYALLEHVSDWVYRDNMVCCESLRQAAIHSAYTTPVPGLVGWCVRGPLVCCHLKLQKQNLINSTSNPSTSTSASTTVSNSSSTKDTNPNSTSLPTSISSSSPCDSYDIDSLLTSLDKLHLALLQSLMFTAGVNLSPGLISTGDLVHITQTLTSRSYTTPQEESACQVALERLAQILQVASHTRTYLSDHDKLKEMESLATHKLPHNRLLSLVLADKLKGSQMG